MEVNVISALDGIYNIAERKVFRDIARMYQFFIISSQ
jgi:hypothetical protein